MKKKRFFVVILLIVLIANSLSALAWEEYAYVYLIDPDGDVVDPYTGEPSVYGYVVKRYITTHPPDSETGFLADGTINDVIADIDIALVGLIADKSGKYHFCLTTNSKNDGLGTMRDPFERAALCEEVYGAYISGTGADAAYADRAIIQFVYQGNELCSDEKYLECDFHDTSTPPCIHGTGDNTLPPESIKVGDYVRCGTNIGACTVGWKKCLSSESQDSDWDPPYSRCQVDADVNADVQPSPKGGDEYGNPLFEICGTGTVQKNHDDADEDCNGVVDDYGLIEGLFTADSSSEDSVSSDSWDNANDAPLHSTDFTPELYIALNAEDSSIPLMSYTVLQCSEYSQNRFNPSGAVSDCTHNIAPGEMNGTWVGSSRFNESAACCGNIQGELEYFTKYEPYYWVGPVGNYPTACWTSHAVWDDSTANVNLLHYADTLGYWRKTDSQVYYTYQSVSISREPNSPYMVVRIN